MTKVYGLIDSTIAVSGDFACEFDYDREEGPVQMRLSDGTELEIKICDLEIWRIALLKHGTLLVRIDKCPKESDFQYSDIAWFDRGIFGCSITPSTSSFVTGRDLGDENGQ